MRYEPKEQQSGSVSKQKLSKAAKSYLDRAQKYNEMMSEARAEYNIGMRHLANMMGRDANTFTQADANVNLISLITFYLQISNLNFSFLGGY